MGQQKRVPLEFRRFRLGIPDWNLGPVKLWPVGLLPERSSEIPCYIFLELARLPSLCQVFAALAGSFLGFANHVMSGSGGQLP